MKAKHQEPTINRQPLIAKSQPPTTNRQKPISYGHQNITPEDIDAVVKVLKSDFLTQGPEIVKFENAFAEYIVCKYAVAVANGTAALHLCALALDVKSGDKVITTPITFAASANCVRYAGGDVVFADIDPKTYLLNIKEVEKLLKSAPRGTYQGVIPVDLAGRAVDMEAFRKLADEYGLWIIEDACHAPGGYFIDSKGEKYNCGNGDFAELSIFSFHPVKHIATGEGGMITTNDKKLYKKLLMLRTHGITKDANSFQNSLETAYGNAPMINNDARSANEPMTAAGHNDAKQMTNDYPGWYYEMQELGYNYRLTDFQASLGASQLKRADQGLKRRREIADTYKKAFEGKSFIKGQSGVVDGHAYHLYIIEVEDKKGLYDFLHKHNIFAQVHYVPLHLMPYYKQFGWKEGGLPFAKNYYRHCLSLPMYPTLSGEEQLFVIKTIEEYYA